MSSFGLLGALGGGMPDWAKPYAQAQQTPANAPHLQFLQSLKQAAQQGHAITPQGALQQVADRQAQPGYGASTPGQYIQPHPSLANFQQNKNMMDSTFAALRSNGAAASGGVNPGTEAFNKMFADAGFNRAPPGPQQPQQQPQGQGAFAPQQGAPPQQAAPQQPQGQPRPSMMMGAFGGAAPRR